MAEAVRDANDRAEPASVTAVRMRPDQYILMRTEEDRDAAYRWNVLKEVRRRKASVTDKILEYLRRNVGKQITGEELKYLAKDTKEWARWVRELRTEACNMHRPSCNHSGTPPDRLSDSSHLKPDPTDRRLRGPARRVTS